MMEAYSPQRDGDSIMHSPHRLRCYDNPAMADIRRSLSRSPSKPQNSLRSMSPASGAMPFQSSPLSPSRRSTSDVFLHAATSPYGSKSTPGIRINRPNMRRTAHTTSALRRTSPQSPSKRILASSSNSGNSTPVPVRKRSSDEAEREQSLKALTADQENVACLDEALHTRSVYTRQEKRRSGGSLMSFIPPQSPRKRSEGGMNFEETGRAESFCQTAQSTFPCSRLQHLRIRVTSLIGKSNDGRQRLASNRLTGSCVAILDDSQTLVVVAKIDCSAASE